MSPEAVFTIKQWKCLNQCATPHLKEMHQRKRGSPDISPGSVGLGLIKLVYSLMHHIVLHMLLLNKVLLWLLFSGYRLFNNPSMFLTYNFSSFRMRACIVTINTVERLTSFLMKFCFHLIERKFIYCRNNMQNPPPWGGRHELNPQAIKGQLLFLFYTMKTKKVVLFSANQFLASCLNCEVWLKHVLITRRVNVTPWDLPFTYV